MRTLKKTLALVLCLAMIAGLCCFGTSAAFADAAEIKNVEAVEVVNAIGVIKGDGTNFNPTGILTRAEAAVMIAKMLGAPANGTSTFKDMAGFEWAQPYAAFCERAGIILGDGKGNFLPGQQLTGYQYTLMLARALGYKPAYEGVDAAAYEIGTAALLKKIGLADALVNFDGTVGLTRDNAAAMTFKALTTNMVEYRGGLDVTAGNTSIKQDPTRYNMAGSASKNYNNALAGDGIMQFCELYFPALSTTTGTDAYGYTANLWYLGTQTPANLIGAYTGVVVLATYTNVSYTSSNDLYKVFGLTADASIPVYENGTQNGTVSAARGVATPVLTAYKGATVKAVKDAGVNKLIVEYPYLAVVTDVTPATAVADRKVALSIFNTSSPVTGVDYTTEKFAKGDYVLVYVDGKIDTTAAYTLDTQFEAAGVIVNVVAAESVSGKVTDVAMTSGSATSITIGGTAYPVAGASLDCMGLGGSDVANGGFGYTTDYTLFLSNGYVVGAVGEVVAKNIQNIVYVTGAAYQSYSATGVNWVVNTVNLDGTVEAVKADDGADQYYTGTSVFAAGFYTKTFDPVYKTYTFAPVEDTYAGIDNSTTFYAGVTVEGALDMKATTLSWTFTDAAGTPVTNRAYIVDTSRMMFVKAVGNTVLSATVSTGAMRQAFADNAVALVSKDALGNFIVEAIVKTDAAASVSDDVLYVDNTQTGENANGETVSAWDVKTGEKKTITVADASAVTTGFNLYEIDAKGVYTLTPGGITAATANNGDGYYAIDNKTDIAKFGAAVSFEAGTYDVIDLPYASAVITNATAIPGDLSLDMLAKASTLAATIVVDELAVTAIIVTSYVA